MSSSRVAQGLTGRAGLLCVVAGNLLWRPQERGQQHLASVSLGLASAAGRRHDTRPRGANTCSLCAALGGKCPLGDASCTPVQPLRCRASPQGNEEKPANEEQAADVAEERQARKKPIPKDLARRLLDMIEVGRAWL